MPQPDTAWLQRGDCDELSLERVVDRWDCRLRPVRKLADGGAGRGEYDPCPPAVAFALRQHGKGAALTWHRHNDVEALALCQWKAPAGNRAYRVAIGRDDGALQCASINPECGSGRAVD